MYKYQIFFTCGRWSYEFQTNADSKIDAINTFKEKYPNAYLEEVELIKQ